jgi:O-antigen ligase
VHTAEVILDRGWNQWSLVGWSSKSSEASFATRDYTTLRMLALLASLAGGLAFVFSLRHARWGEAFATLRDVRLVPSAVAGALIVWGAAALTWAQDAAFAFRNFGTASGYVLGALASAVWIWAPIFAISLIGLGVLFVLVVARLDVGLALLAFFIPFYLLPQRVFAWSFSMVELLTLMCLVSFMVRSSWFIVRGTRHQHHEPRARNFELLDAGMLTLVIAGVISTVYAQQQVEAWRELRMAIVEPALVYGILRMTPVVPSQRRNILLALVAGGLAVACIGLVNYARGVVFPAELGIPRIRSVYGSPNNDALFLGRMFAILLPAAILSRQWAQARWQRIAAWGGLGVVAIALVLSQSRGALLLGVPICAIAVCLAAGGRWRKIGFVGMAGLLVGLLVLATGLGAQIFAGTRLANALDLSRGTGFIRVNLWQSAMRMWMDNVWLGVGPDNFLYAYRSAYILPAAWQEPNLSHPHNVLLDFATRLGVGGLIALGLIVAGAARKIVSGLRATNSRSMALIALGVLAYTLGHGLVDHSYFLIDLAFVWAVVMGLAVTRGEGGLAG